MSKSKPIPALFIKAKHDGYRRAGFVHTRTGTGIALSALTEEQIQLLKNDPHLVVEACEFEGDDNLERQEAERIAAEQARAAKIAADELAEAERIAAEKAAAEKAEAEKAGAQKVEAQKVEAQKAEAKAAPSKKAK